MRSMRPSSQCCVSSCGAAPAAQQAVAGELAAMMQEQMLAGAVTPVWETADRRVGYFAAPQYHSLLAALTLDFVRANLNRELTALRPPPYVPLSSPGSQAYIDFLAAERGGPPGGAASDPVDHPAPETPAFGGPPPRTVNSGPGAFGGPPPSPEPPAQMGHPRPPAARGVEGGSPSAPHAAPRPDFGAPALSRKN
ncbi:MAG: hypothetical protein AB7E79_12225 [Rhodospirillaceae bacterium]